MTRKVIVAPEAAAEIERIDDWWRLHRPKHPGLFTKEVASAFRRISALPGAGRLMKNTSLDRVRRILLSKTAYHLYYRYSQHEVQVLVIWSARFEEEEPPL